MKQNERILVYAVTGFLAIILAVAVLFGRENPRPQPAPGGGPGVAGQSAANPAGAGAPASLGDIVSRKAAPGAGATPVAGGENGAVPVEPAGAGAVPSVPGASGLPAPAGPEQALVASKPLIAADLVLQALGSSRRDRAVRFVPARAGDSLETLVRRWCGATQPYLEEAKSLNEELTVVRVGQEIAVPWIEDEVVFAAFEARQPKKLVADAVDQGKTAVAAPAAATPNGAERANPAQTNPSNQTNPNNPTNATNAGGPTIGSLLSPKPRPVTPKAVADQTPAVAGGVVPGKPAIGKPAASEAVTPPEAKTAGTRAYVVKSGDSLWKIAEQLYGKKNADRMVGEIKKLNAGKVDTLRPNQKLVVPEAAAAVAAPAKGA